MNCRNCGAELTSPQAMVCVKCGVPPLVEKKFCQNCGAPTSESQVMCTNCGVQLVSRTPAGAPGAKSKVAAGLLAIFLGTLGIHKFYLGLTKEGVILLLASIIGGIITLGIVTGVIGLITFIEGIIYITKTDEQFDEQYVQNKKAWF